MTGFGKNLRLLLYISLAAVVAYAGFTFWSGWEETVQAARRVGLGGGALLLSLSVFNYAVRFGRWQFYLAQLGYRVPVGPSLHYYLASFAFTVTPGKLGEGVRSFYLKPHGVPLPASFSALFVERLFDLSATLIFATLGVFYFGRYLPLVAVPVVAVMTILLLLASAGFRGWLRRGRVGRMTGVLDALEAVSVLSRGRLLVIGLLLSLLGWGAEATAFYVTLKLIGLELPLLASVGVYGLAISIGALSFLPGGLGGYRSHHYSAPRHPLVRRTYRHCRRYGARKHCHAAGGARMKQPERFVPLLLILGLGAVYTATLLPGISYSGDTIKFQCLGHVLGTANAPGYPLYLTLNHIMSLLPFSSLTYKANLFSALCAVGACLALYGLYRFRLKAI